MGHQGGPPARQLQHLTDNLIIPELVDRRTLSVSGCSVRIMVVRQLIPEGLAAVAPGPELAGVLAGIELSRLSGYDCVEVLKARYRQLNHERARLMATMVEVGLCGIGPDDELPRTVVPDEFAADEVRAALVWTRRAADAQFWLAHDLMSRLPAVHAAMDAGVLDEPRARVLSDWTTGLDPEAARAVCTELLPRAPRLTTGQLIEQIKKLAIALDPDWARRRYEQAVADRKVVGYRNTDGSANLSGVNLPVDRVAAASGHIDALAKAAKHGGDLRPIDHIRADLFLGMTDGSYTGLDDKAILDHLRTTRENEDEPDDGSYGSADEDCGPIWAISPPAETDPKTAAGPLRTGARQMSRHSTARRALEWSCGFGCPPCSGTISIPLNSLAGAPCTPSWPATSLLPWAARNGALRSPTNTGTWPTAESPESDPLTRPSGWRAVERSWNWRSPSPPCAPWPSGPPSWAPGPQS